jgi:hypothetical protein
MSSLATACATTAPKPATSAPASLVTASRSNSATTSVAATTTSAAVPRPTEVVVTPSKPVMEPARSGTAWLFDGSQTVAWSSNRRIVEGRSSNCGSPLGPQLKIGARVAGLDGQEPTTVNGINSETCSGQPEPTFASPMAGWSAITEWNAQPRPVSTERTTDPTYLRAAEWEASDVSIWRIVAGESPVRVGQAA